MTAKDRKGPQKTAPVVMVGVDGTKLLKPEEVAAITGLSIETLAQPAT